MILWCNDEVIPNVSRAASLSTLGTHANWPGGISVSSQEEGLIVISGSSHSQSNCVSVYTADPPSYSWNLQCHIHAHFHLGAYKKRLMILQNRDIDLSTKAPCSHHLPMGLLSHSPCHICHFPKSGCASSATAVGSSSS